MSGSDLGAAEQTFSNPFFTISVLDARRIVYIVRTATPFASREEIETGCEPVQRELDLLGRAGRRLLVDTRQAVGNNNPVFEANFAGHRKRMADGFERVALLTQTIIGKMHNERLVQQDRAGAPRVFIEPGEALVYLRDRTPIKAARPSHTDLKAVRPMETATGPKAPSIGKPPLPPRKP